MLVLSVLLIHILSPIIVMCFLEGGGGGGGGGGYRGGLLNSMRNRKSVINEANDIFQNFIYFLIHSYLNNQC